MLSRKIRCRSLWPQPNNIYYPLWPRQTTISKKGLLIVQIFHRPSSYLNLMFAILTLEYNFHNASLLWLLRTFLLVITIDPNVVYTSNMRFESTFLLRLCIDESFFFFDYRWTLLSIGGKCGWTSATSGFLLTFLCIIHSFCLFCPQET